MANRLKQANIATADGFSLNVSNFVATGDNLSYGKQISSAVGGKHFVVDTSRNGNGAAPNNEWCNPSGRALGPLPTTNTGNSLTDAYLWVKGPGGSDGTCNGGGAAGTWSASLALPLAQNAGW
jgi:endoglucanase